MRVPVFPIVASLALLAAPAFAQNATTNSDQNGGGYNSNGVTGSPNAGMSGYSNSGTNTYNGTIGGYNQQYQNPQTQANEQSGATGYSNGWRSGTDISSDTRERIRQSLMQSGFRDVRVTPEAFVIHAQAPDGSHVVMLLRPDVVTGVIEQSGNTGYSNNGSSNANNWNNGSSGTSGSSSTENGTNR